MPVKNQESSSKKKILLAEDDDSMRRFLEITLQRANFDVISAEDGLEAMKATLENQVDAVVADAIMPNLSGYDLCRIFRQNPDNGSVPFIILSGFNIEDSPNSEDCPADAFLTKKSNLKEELTQTLARFLSEKIGSQ